MQPDLLSIQREEEQAESIPPQDLTPSESLSMLDATPLEATPLKETPVPQPVLPTGKKRSKLNFAVIGLVLLSFILFLAFGWVGYWAYTLNAELISAQQQLTALQAEHEKLQADYTTLTSEKEQLNAVLTQSKADLEKASADLTSAQADLSKSKQNGEKLETQIDTAGQLLEILYVMTTSDHESDVLKVDRLVNESNDKELIKQWDTFTRSPSEDSMSAFLGYLVSAIRNNLQ